MFGSKSMRLTAKAGGYFIMTGCYVETLIWTRRVTQPTLA